jgi:hypothetical protein
MMVVRMRMRKWEDSFEAKVPWPIKVDGGGSIGFLEVFENADAYNRAYPGENDCMAISPHPH